MKERMEQKLLSLLALILGCLALMAAGGLLLSGCASNDAAYQQVVDEVNAKYGVHLKLDPEGKKDITPEQLRVHLEAMARNQKALHVL